MINGTYFTTEDGTIFDIRHVIIVETGHHNEYQVNLSGGNRVVISEDYFSRAAFLAAWQGV